MRHSIHSSAFLGTLAISAAMLLASHSHAATPAASKVAAPSPEAIAACVGQKAGATVKITQKDGKAADGLCVMRGTQLVAIPKPIISVGP